MFSRGFEAGAEMIQSRLVEQEVVFRDGAGNRDRRRGEAVDALAVEIGARRIFERGEFVVLEFLDARDLDEPSAARPKREFVPPISPTRLSFAIRIPIFVQGPRHISDILLQTT